MDRIFLSSKGVQKGWEFLRNKILELENMPHSNQKK